VPVAWREAVPARAKEGGAMFVQLMEFTSNREEEIEDLENRWEEQTEGKRTANRSVIVRDRNRPDHYYAIVEFPSYEEAMRNSELPETQQFAQRMAALCQGDIRYVDTDVVRDDMM
jgi:hypothetical protein